MLIEIEGIDGAGKTTQSRLLKKWIVGRGLSCQVVREPAGTRFGKMMRELIMSDVPRGRKAETFSFLAAKSQLYSQIITPALAKGKCIITDRGSLSFLSYHHVYGGVEISLLQTLMKFAVNEISPTLTVLIDIPANFAFDRMRDRKRSSPFDRMGQAFFTRQRETFLHLCEMIPNCVVVDGSLSMEAVHEKITAASSIFVK